MSDEPLVPNPAPAQRDTQPATDATVDRSELDLSRSFQISATVVQATEAAARAANESRGPWFAAVEGYEVQGELGHGAMGVVYKARHIKLNRLVALKTTLGGRVEEKDLIRFLAEAESVAAVKHPNVVQVYDYGESDGRPFMALEFCPGGSLAQRLQTGPPLPPRDVAALVSRIAAGVAAAHEEGIVHRDLKPGNVLLTEDGQPKVADFGLAKRSLSDLTATQAVMGTPSYMSPEQAGGKAKFVGPQADVWSLGVILYECLSGAKPFPGTTTDEVLVKIITADPPAVRTLNSNVPRDLELVCRKCLEKDPVDRYASAKELADDLERFGRGEPISARPLSPITRTLRWAQRNPVVAVLLGLVVLVTLGLIGSLYAQYQQAVNRADTEREAKESAERESQQAEIARQNAELARRNAEVAVQETARREEAERLRAKADLLATRSAAAAAQADVLIELLNDMFRSSDPLAGFFGDSLPGLPTAGASEGQAAILGPFLLNAAERFRATLTDPAAALVRAKLLASIGNGMKSLGMFAEAKKVLAEALALRRANLPDTNPDLWQSELDLGRLETEGGDYLASLDRFRKVLALQTRAGAGLDATLTTKLYLGITLSTAGLSEADSVLRDVLKQRERLNGKSHKDTILAQIALIAWLLEKHQTAEIVAQFNQFRESVRALPAGRIRDIFEAVLDCQLKLAYGQAAMAPGSMLAGTLPGTATGMRKEIVRLEKLLPDDHVILLVFRFELAKMLLRLNEGKEADELFARVLADVKKTTGLAHPKMLVFLDVFAHRMVATKRAGEARALFEQAEKAIRTRFGPESPWLTALLLQRASFELKQGAPDKALVCANDAIALMNRGKFMPTSDSVIVLLQSARSLGASPTKALRTAARELFAALRPIVVRVHGEASEEMVVVLAAEGKMLLEMNDRATAAATFEKARALLPAVPKLDPDTRVEVLQGNGRLALDSGRFADAERHFRALREAAKGARDYSAYDRAQDGADLAAAMVGQQKFRDAALVYAEAQKGVKRQEADLAWTELTLTALRLAARDREAHDTTVAAAIKAYQRSTDTNTLARLTWAVGLSPDASPADAAIAAKALAAVLTKFPKFAWGHSALALVSLRAGDLAAAEAALDAAGPTTDGRQSWPVYPVLRGLLAAKRGDLSAARRHLRMADRLMTEQRPSDTNPFAYASTIWVDRLIADLLCEELRAALTLPVAPAPHAK